MSTEVFLNFVDGVFCSAQSKKEFPKYNPFTGELLGMVAASDAMDVVRAIQGAKKAQLEFEKWSLEQRAELLAAIAKEFETHADEYAYQEALHQGLPFEFVKDKSLHYAKEQFRQMAEEILRYMKTRTPYLQAQPTGIVSIILSWNLSLRLLSERLAPAIAAGNTCLVKTSELSPITAKILGEVLMAVKAPPGLVQIIQGPGAEVGAFMAAHPSIRAVSFVGKLSNAEKVAQASLAQFKKVQIHTGAKNNIFVLSETDYKNQMPQILQSFLIGQGQTCWNSTRVFVLESFEKDFAEKLKEYLLSLTPATSPRDPSPWLPVISEEVLQKMEIKSQQVKDEEGKLIVGGERAAVPGYFFKPTVSLDLPNCSEMQQEELFGPLLILTVVKYQHEMVKWANTGYYGRSAVIWAPSSEKALKVAEKLDVAEVTVNSWFSNNVVIGHRQSHFGQTEVGPWGHFYSDVKVLTGL